MFTAVGVLSKLQIKVLLAWDISLTKLLVVMTYCYQYAACDLDGADY